MKKLSAFDTAMQTERTMNPNTHHFTGMKGLFKYIAAGLMAGQAAWALGAGNSVTCWRYLDTSGNATERREKAELVVEATVLEAHEAVTRTAYDRRGRPVSRTVAVDGEPEVTLAELEYDPVGRLARDRGAVTAEYGYDIRSNLTAIRSDRFAQTAWYGNSPAGGAVRYGGVNALRTAWFDGQDASGYYTMTETFAYDDLGRYRSSVSGDGDISEEVSVDLDGNVTDIMRVYKGDAVQDAIMEYAGGKVIAVHDASAPYWAEEVGRFPAGDHDLAYDLDGRLKSDGTRGVSDISYYPFGNLPHRVQMESGDRMFSHYIPDGTLVRRQFTTRTVRTVTQVTAGGDTVVKEYPQDRTVIRWQIGRFERTTGGGWTLLTEAGHYDLAEKRHYWHLRDRLGSTVAVVDAKGGFRQTTAYYPSGTPRRLPLMRFATPDPLYADYPSLSPWSHCAADPLNRVDPTGCKIKGIGKEDIKIFHDQVKNVLSDEKFQPLLNTLDISRNKLVFRKNTDVASVISGIDMTEDEACFVNLLAEGINAESTITVEFISSQELISYYGLEVILKAWGFLLLPSRTLGVADGFENGWEWEYHWEMRMMPILS